MNWAAVALVSWIALGLDVGLASALQLGDDGVRPAFTLILLAFLSCHARQQDALWLALILGVVLDLTHEILSPGNMSALTVVGPGAIGCVGASYAVLVVRGSIMRSSLLAMPFLVGMSVVVAHLVYITMVEARSWYDPQISIDAARAMWRAVLIALYTAVFAIPLAPLLIAFGPVFAFQHSVRSRSWR